MYKYHIYCFLQVYKNDKEWYETAPSPFLCHDRYIYGFLHHLMFYCLIWVGLLYINPGIVIYIGIQFQKSPYYPEFLYGILIKWPRTPGPPTELREENHRIGSPAYLRLLFQEFYHSIPKTLPRSSMDHSQNLFVSGLTSKQTRIGNWSIKNHVNRKGSFPGLQRIAGNGSHLPLSSTLSTVKYKNWCVIHDISFTIAVPSLVLILLRRIAMNTRLRNIINLVEILS